MDGDSGVEEKFGENPFRALDSSLYPPARRGEKRPRRLCADSESLLFLRAVENIRGEGKTRKGLCTLGELPGWPEEGMKKKKRNKPAPGAAPPAKSGPPEISDEALFLDAVASTSPLGGKGRKGARHPEPGTPPGLGEPDFEELMASKLEFALSFSDEYMEGHVVGLDDLVMNRLREGALSPEAHLDLHGLNADQAFQALREFMRQAWFKGLRVVLLVPGRGRNSPDARGVLRQKLREWLTQEPFKRAVLAFCTAQPHDGGPGSLYALLRSRRKKGKVAWERWPQDPDLY